jgi:hypothetical protein
MLQPTKESVAAQLSEMGIATKPEELTDAQLATFGTPDTVVPPAVPVVEAPPVIPAVEAPPAVTSAPDPIQELEAKLKAEYDRKIADLQARIEQQAKPPEAPAIPDRYAPYFNKELNDPAQNIFGGIVLSDELTPTETVQYWEARDNYNRAIWSYQQEQEQTRQRTVAQQAARDTFLATHPGVDIKALEKAFEVKGLDYDEAHRLTEVRKAGGWDKYLEAQTASQLTTLNAKIAADKTVADAKAASDKLAGITLLPLNNADGTTQRPVAIGMPKTIDEYNNLPPEQKMVLAKRVGEAWGTG